MQRIAVHEGDRVAAGQVLVQLDEAPFRHALDQAKAQLQQTGLNLAAMQADYTRLQRDVSAQEAAVQLAQATFDRSAQIVSSGAVSRSTYDQGRYGLQQAQQTLESLRAQAKVQLAKLGGTADAPVEQHPDYLEAAAKLAEAQRQLDHATLRAPFSGIVTQVSTLQPGPVPRRRDAGLRPGLGRAGLGGCAAEGDRPHLCEAGRRGDRHDRYLSRA